MMDRAEVQLLFDRVVRDPPLLPACWACRRRPIRQALARDAADLETIEVLLHALGERQQTAQEQTRLERVHLRQSEQVVRFLDDTLLTSPIGSWFIGRLCQLWLGLEVQVQPDERGVLADFRDQLIHAADCLEIDLRDFDL